MPRGRKPGWSERGEGGGRKATGRIKQFVTTSVSGSPEEIAMIKRKAAAAGKTVSRFVIGLVSELPE